MRILHLCLACFYIDGYNYQENFLPRINKADGHEVKIIASTETYIDNYNLGYVEPGEYYTEDGIPIKRLPYTKLGNKKLTVKIRKYKRLYDEIESFNPDVIMVHDLTFYSIVEVIKYVKRHRNVKLYADTHTSAVNSGTNWVSLNLLHRRFYKYLAKKAEPFLAKYLYIGEDEKAFSVINYKMSPDNMEFYPLGGVVFKREQYEFKRKSIRESLGLQRDELLLVHSGKLTKRKRTEELIRAFSSVPEMKAKLIVIGSIPEDSKERMTNLINADDRIEYLGWKNSSELTDYLCACDLYCQPGGVSATFQNAICCNCPVLTYRHAAYKAYDYGNLVWIETETDIEIAFRKINDKKIDLEKWLNNQNNLLASY